jgi:putative transposase
VRYRSTNKAVYSAKYHLIWTPRYRKRVLVGPVADRLKEIIAGVVEELGAEVLEIAVMPDHVHLLVECPPVVALSKLLMLSKGRSSRLLRQEFPRWQGARMRSLWSPSWFCSTVGGAPREVVRRYVENQKTAA